jgi:PleD family two-component response regulator
MNSQDQAQINVLLVAKDPITLESASVILKEAGYTIHLAFEAKDCMTSVLQLKPDLILMDAVEADSGVLDICRCLKADPTLSLMPVVLMITDFHSRALDAAFQSGAVDCVRKPLNPMELQWRIDRLMKPRPSTEGQSKAQKYKTILETAAEVCHKLNQPLQYVMGTVQFLLMDMSTEDKLFDRLDMIRQKAELMGDITRKLTALTRHGAET